MSTGCPKKFQQSQSTPTWLCHNWQNTTAMHGYGMPRLYVSNSSIQQPDSQVNNCSMCPSWTWTTAFNPGRHWSTALLHVLVEAGPTGAHSVLEIIQTHDSSHTTAGYSCQLFIISETYAGPRVVFRTGCSGLVVEYRTRNQEVAGSTLSQMGGSNLPRPHLVIFYFFPSA